MAKDAYLYSAKMEVTLEDSIFDAFVFCVNDAVIMKLQGKAVINMSFGTLPLLQ